MKLGITTPVRLAVAAFVAATIAGVAFAPAASATDPHPRRTHSACVIEPTGKAAIDTWPKPPTCPPSSPASASPSPSKSASTSASPSARVTESASGTAHRSPTMSASPVAASLPVTGTSGTIALVGLGLVLVGGVAILVSRMRRKVSFVVE